MTAALFLFCLPFGWGMAIQHAAGFYAESSDALLGRNDAWLQGFCDVSLLALRLVMYLFCVTFLAGLSLLVALLVETICAGWLIDSAEKQWREAAADPDRWLPKHEA